MIKYIGLLIACSALCLGTTLTGTLLSPMSGTATGSLFLTPPLNVGLIPACGGFQGATGPQSIIAILVTNGVLQSPPVVTGNDCFLPTRTTYNVRFVDTAGHTFTGSWVITGSSIDVGTLVLGAPGVIQSMPPSDQTVGQPNGSRLYINHIGINDMLGTDLASTPSVNPSPGQTLVYTKSGKQCSLSPAGVETCTGGTGGGGGLADPGSNSIVLRTALNVTAPAVPGSDYSAPATGEVTTASRTFSNVVDAHGATKTLPDRTGTGSPNGRDNCSTVGETFWQTDTTNGAYKWACTGTGTPGVWTPQGGPLFSGVLATSSTGITGTSAAPILSCAPQAGKSPQRFEFTLSTNVTSVTLNNCPAGASIYIAWTQGSGPFTLTYGGSVTNTCGITRTNAATTVQLLQVAANGTTIQGLWCSGGDATVEYNEINTSAVAGATGLDVTAADSTCHCLMHNDNNTGWTYFGIAPLPSPGTTATLAGANGFAICTGTCTITVPVPAANKMFCVTNDNNVATAITLSALGAGAMYQNQAGTAYGTAGTGTLTATAAAGNKVCLLGRDATHYLFWSGQGTWTAN